MTFLVKERRDEFYMCENSMFKGPVAGGNDKIELRKKLLRLRYRD